MEWSGVYVELSTLGLRQMRWDVIDLVLELTILQSTNSMSSVTIVTNTSGTA